MIKKCSKCKELKDEKEFNKDISSRTGLRAYCRLCSNEHNKQWQQNNKYKRNNTATKWRKNNIDKYTNTVLRTKFGISLKDYDKMLDEQNGKCAICGQYEIKTFKGKVIKLAVDHDHNTNKVRGLLCSHCNIAIGQLYNDPILCEAAAIYLRRDNAKKERSRD